VNETGTVRASVVGAGGYIGGELVRLLLQHPRVELAQMTSNRNAGRPVQAAHPNLRGHTDLAFVPDSELEPCDVLFLALPHGVAAGMMDRWAALAPSVIDLSADHRLADPADYERYYRGRAPDPKWQARFQAGFPELNREGLRGARHIAVPGCMANAAILALHPLAAAGAVAGEVLVDARTGSSGGGTTPDESSHHPERSGSLRVFKPHGHRHVAEIEQACRVPVRMTATAIEAVRGVQAVCHVDLAAATTERELWALYRRAYGGEPFVRLLRDRSSLRRMPEPKILSGSNHCDIGLALDPAGRRVVAAAAIDNLMKGGAGNAVQCLNIAFGWDERAGLGFAGLHPA
jgi:LysW-gamma-L-alpha-aminoadipyl-6-phosphate/LysW-L-glutamyl-5-phosphate reductase